MTFTEKLAIIAGLSAALAATGMSLSRVERTRGRTLLPAVAVAVIALALVIVGLVSGTLTIHLVQVAPLVVALALLWRGSNLGLAAAVPLCVFWLLVMGGIWLFLLGIARIFTGTFSPMEIALTLVIGVAGTVGIVGSIRQPVGLSRSACYAMAVVFSVLQAGALWLSYLPFIVGR
jgi:hypothetical protein